MILDLEFNYNTLHPSISKGISEWFMFCYV